MPRMGTVFLCLHCPRHDHRTARLLPTSLSRRSDSHAGNVSATRVTISGVRRRVSTGSVLLKSQEERHEFRRGFSATNACKYQSVPLARECALSSHPIVAVWLHLDALRSICRV